MERKYSVAEIDQMRAALSAIAVGRERVVSSARVEDRLRTYMLNGTDPAELTEEASKYIVVMTPGQSNKSIVAIES